MLVLTERQRETVIIGGSIQVTVLAIGRNKVKLGFSAPPEITIHREKVQERIRREARQHRLEPCTAP